MNDVIQLFAVIVLPLASIGALVFVVWLNNAKSDQANTHLREALAAAHRELEYAHTRLTLPREAASEDLGLRRLEATAEYNQTLFSQNGSYEVAPDLPPDMEQVL